MMSGPKVSVCIPAYKQPEYLRRALTSIMSQTYTNYEVIVTDDSPDRAVEQVINDFRHLPNLRYCKNTTKQGSPGNWNTASSLAIGEYIKLLHHDDWLSDENSLGRFVSLLDENPTANFGFSGTTVWRADTGVERVHSATDLQLQSLLRDPAVLFLGNFVGAPSATIYRRTEHLAYDTRMIWLVDIDFYIRLLSKNGAFAFCPEPLIHTTDGGLHQITQFCINNEHIELFEYSHLFNKLYDETLSLAPYARVFEQLFTKYTVTSFRSFDDIGLARPEPEQFFRGIMRRVRLGEPKRKLARWQTAVSVRGKYLLVLCLLWLIRRYQLAQRHELPL